MNVSRTEDDDDDEWCGGHDHCMPLPLLMMNSLLMQMMQHDRVSLLNNPSRKINQHGRGQSTFIFARRRKRVGKGNIASEKEWSIFCWRKLYYLQLTDVSLIEQVIWRRDIIIYVLNYSLPPYYSSSSFPRTKV